MSSCNIACKKDVLLNRYVSACNPNLSMFLRFTSKNLSNIK